MANLGRPAFIRDEVKPGRMLAARAMHLSEQRGGLELGSVIPTARAARVTVARGMRTQREGEGTGTSAACSLPLRGAVTAIRGRRLAAPVRNRGGAAAALSPGQVVARQR
jgi:hypothetical protein